MKKYLYVWIPILVMCFSCACTKAQSPPIQIKVGAENLQDYLSDLSGKNIALLVNQTSVINDTHLLDTLLALNVNVTKVFAPEHGFRGNKANGELVKNEKDVKTGIPIISLYGKNKKPTSENLEGLDIVIYDIQDVGSRFYTYISAMHYMMESCADENIQFIVLDRPNPNGHYVDGPVMDKKFTSYVGMHEIPIVYGMTSGEVAKMIVGEKWLNSTKVLDLKVVKNTNYNHDSPYSLAISPSPNLPNDKSIAWYPSLCLFEGTPVSIGRGTEFPFQIIGTPDSSANKFTFTPLSKPGYSKYPKFENKKCFGVDLRKTEAPDQIDLNYLIQFYNQSKNKSEFFNPFFVKLAGTDQLQNQIENGMTAEEIRKSWESDLKAFNQIRSKYLLYD